MDVVGSEIGQKMRSAIKAKLTELGCYVDDELPDYVMVMVANKRTRAQMDEDLQLFLGDNTELFVNWLHQVLKKLQEVQVTAPLRVETEKVKERSKSKERKPKEKKEKEKLKKSDAGKKTKKKEKEKTHKKKEDKKVHKEKRKNKHNESIRPNIPPMLMNMEKHSEPSITDVFAGQILKNHGITLGHKHDITQIDALLLKEKKPILPIIDPASIPSQSEPSPDEDDKNAAREEQIKEVHDIEAKISGLKKKLADQLDTMSEDEDFLNIRTEAEELLNDFAEDVFQEISQTAPVTTPPLDSRKSPISHTPAPLIQTPKVLPKDLPKDTPKNISKELSKDLLKKTPKEPVDILPHIELNLPKRPIRERLGVRGTTKESAENKEKDKNKAKLPTSPERLTPERQPEMKPEQTAKKYSGGTPERPWRSSVSDESSVEKPEQNKRPISKVSALAAHGARASCASVVRVRPRPRVCAPANNLLMKAVADAHKSLLNAPPKIEPQQRKLQRALVLPMRRCIDNQKIVIQVPRDVQTDTNTNITTDLENNGENKNKSSNNIVNREDKEIISPVHITKVINNTDYVPDRTASKRDDTLIIETKNKQKSNSKKHRNTQFIVTMDGFQPNTFLAKKLMMEGLLDENDELAKTALPKPAKSVLITKETEEAKEKENNETVQEYENKEDEIMQQESPATENLTRKLSDSSEIPKIEPSDVEIKALSDTSDKCDNQKKRLSDASEESYTQVIIKTEPQEAGEKRKSVDESVSDENSEKMLTPPIKKRKASPIVFNIDKKEKETERARERTQSASSDGHVTITTSANSHKFDSVPPLSVAERKLVWCRAFPLCRYGSACAFAHPRCKFAAGCTRRACAYSHSPPASPASPPAIASHVVPAANYKTISSVGAISICKYYPSCVNPVCHFYHPKPCRYGKACGNKLECNFYHNDAPAAKWKYA